MELKIGQRIKEQRDEKQLTQKALADIIQVDPTIISKWELNKKRPIYEDLVSLALFFDVSVEYMLGLEDEFGKRQ